MFETEWFSLEAIHHPEISSKPYYRILSNNAVIVLARTKQGKFVLIRQYRPALDEMTIEFPAGYVEEDEDPMDAAKRELFEESGYNCEGAKLIGKFNISPSRINSSLFGFFCDKVEAAAKRIKNDTKTELILVSEKELTDMMTRNGCSDLASISVFNIAKMKGFLQKI